MTRDTNGKSTTGKAQKYNPYKLNAWRLEFRTLAKMQGKTPRMLCEYLGSALSEKPSFWMKMPLRREMFIGLGMALKQPCNVINRWITVYGDKKKLYVKDVMSDLVWIYLIEANCRDKETDINYYQMYEETSALIEQAYLDVWRAETGPAEDTYNLERSMDRVEYSHEHLEIVKFVERHMSDINTAYQKPRRMLRTYVDAIVDVLNENESVEWNLSRLRGYLDDSMVNYLAGNPDIINVIDKKTRVMTPVFKTMPATKEAHVRLGIALGMTEPDINRYLELMGYAPLSEIEPEEYRLINILNRWEENNTEQRDFKKEYIYHEDIEAPLTSKARLAAVDQMLSLKEHVAKKLKSN